MREKHRAETICQAKHEYFDRLCVRLYMKTNSLQWTGGSLIKLKFELCLVTVNFSVESSSYREPFC